MYQIGLLIDPSDHGIGSQQITLHVTHNNWSKTGNPCILVIMLIQQLEFWIWSWLFMQVSVGSTGRGLITTGPRLSKVWEGLTTCSDAFTVPYLEVEVWQYRLMFSETYFPPYMHDGTYRCVFYRSCLAQVCIRSTRFWVWFPTGHPC